jgi:Ca2+-binding EF-hand superfamily protein
MKNSVYYILSVLLALIGFGCGSSNSDDEQDVQSAAAVEALSEGDTESLNDVSAGDVAASAEEEADAEVDENTTIENDCSFEAIRERVISHYDQNGDGKLEKKERRALADDMVSVKGRKLRWGWRWRLVRLAWIYNADKSGKLSAEERQNLREDLETRCENRMEKLLAEFDTNKNGVLDSDEWTAARAALKERRQAKVKEILATYDTNGDGKLTGDERKAFVKDLVTKIKEKRAKLIAKFDKDGDGKLNAEEKSKLRDYLRSRVRGETSEDNS